MEINVGFRDDLLGLGFKIKGLSLKFGIGALVGLILKLCVKYWSW